MNVNVSYLARKGAQAAVDALTLDFDNPADSFFPANSCGDAQNYVPLVRVA